MTDSAPQTDRLTATAVFIRGLPGSGKTVIAQKVLHDFRNNAVVMLDPDVTDYDSAAYHEHVQRQLSEQVDPSLHAYRFLRAQAYAAIEQGGTFIWNQPFTNLEIFNKMTAGMREQASQAGVDLRIVVVEVMADPSIAWERVQKRKGAGGHGPSTDRFEQFVHDYASFQSEDYDVVAVDGNDIEAAANKIVSYLA